MAKKSRAPALLNSPGRKLQGAGGRCGGFSKACGGALLAGTRARCPHVPSADAGAACCSPPRAGAPQPLLPQAPGQLRNTPRDPAGRGGWAVQGRQDGCEGQSSPLLAAFLSWSLPVAAEKTMNPRGRQKTD